MHDMAWTLVRPVGSHRSDNSLLVEPGDGGNSLGAAVRAVTRRARRGELSALARVRRLGRSAEQNEAARGARVRSSSHLN